MATEARAKGSNVTAREAEVLAGLGRHLTNAQIADELCISLRTVESHVSALLRKLQLPDRRSLARYHDAARAPAGPSRGALPAPVAPFIGRASERATLTAALAEHRLVTATGPGGVGKTRLAISVAAELAAGRRNGARFIDLTQVTDPAMVVPAVAESVGVPQVRSGAIDVALISSLAQRDALLVVDNCEHVVDEVRAWVERILNACPDVTVLATSRCRLLLPYEWVYVVPGLSVSEDGGDAVVLFASRVAAATGGSEHLDPRRVAALCRALDGMALAIELAAARYPTLGLDGLEAGLAERLRFLTGGATDVAGRHWSLRDTIGWSYDLLASEDQALLRCITAFASWFDVDAAHAVAGPGLDRLGVADGLGRLADHSLVGVETGEPTRYRLPETIRQYGIELLDTADKIAVWTRHDQWCRDEISALRAGEPDDKWCVRLDQVVDDIRAVLVRWTGEEHHRAQASELAADLAWLLFARGRPMEAQQRYEQAASLAPSAPERAGYLRLAAGAAATRYVGNDALRLLRDAADTAKDIGDRSAAARDLALMSMYIDRAPGIMADRPPPHRAAALRREARATSDGSASAEAAIMLATITPINAAAAYDGRNGGRAALEPARRAVDVAHRTGDATLESAALDELCAVHLALHDIVEATRAARRRGETIETLSVLASNGFEVLDHHLMASAVSVARGDLVAARAHADALATLPFLRDEHHLSLRTCLMVDALAGNFDGVIRDGERFRLGWERAGRPPALGLARAAYAVAMVWGMQGDDRRRSEWLDMTLELGVVPARLAGCEMGWAPVFDALLALHRNDADSAVGRLSADLDDPEVWGYWNTGVWRPWYAALWAEAAVLTDHAHAASRIERSRPATRDNPIAATIVERAAAIASGAHDSLERCASTFARLGCPYQRARTGTLTTRLRTSP